MRGHSLTALLLLASLPLACCTSGAQFRPDPAPPSGVLGHTIGTYLRVDGMRDSSGKSGASTLRVTRVNGVECAPTLVWLDNLTLPDRVAVVVSGYESGAWIGVPQQVLDAEHSAPHQAAWQFHHFFIVTSVQEPAELAASFRAQSR